MKLPVKILKKLRLLGEVPIRLLLFVSIAIGVSSCDEDNFLQPESQVGEEIAVVESHSVRENPDYVTPEEVANVVKSSYAPKSRSVGYDVKICNNSGGDPLYYIVNFDDDNGYMIISARKTIQPILADVRKGTFDFQTSTLPGISDWVCDVSDAIEESSFAPDSIKQKARSLWDEFSIKDVIQECIMSRGPQLGDKNNHPELLPIMEDSVRIWRSRGWEVTPFEEYNFTDPPRSEMIQNMQSAADWRYIEDAAALSFVVRKTEDRMTSPGNDLGGIEWNQSYPWNTSFPMMDIKNIGYTNAYAGCVTVAGGQLMRYHCYPKTIDWDNIAKNSSYPLYQLQNASDFLYMLATNLGVDYHEGSTSCSMQSLENVFKTYGYTIKTGSKFGSVGMPCVVSKKTSESPAEGHAYILVSYRSSYHKESTDCWTFTGYKQLLPCYNLSNIETSATSYYINWGYGGSGDGFYYNPETAVCPGQGWISSKITYYLYIRKP